MQSLSSVGGTVGKKGITLYLVFDFTIPDTPHKPQPFPIIAHHPRRGGGGGQDYGGSSPLLSFESVMKVIIQINN